MDWMRRLVMNVEARIKEFVKPLIFSSEVVPRRIRLGPGRGVWMRLDRQHGLQKEFGLYETELYSGFRLHASRAEVVYDVGASDGYTSLQLGNLSTEGSVIAFEASPSAVERFGRNLELNPGLAPRVRVVQVWVGSHDSSREDLSCSIRSIDSLVQAEEIPKPDFIKVDVDGGELDVLAGAERTLVLHKPILIVETHSLELEAACIHILRQLGYGVRVVRNAWWRLFWPEYRPIEHNRWLLAVPEPDARGVVSLG